MATQDAVTKLKSQLDPLGKFKRDELINRPKWGEINFEELRPHIDRSFAIVDQLGLLPVELLPDNIVTSITTDARGLTEVFDRLDKFRIQTSGSVTTDRQNLVNQVAAASDRFLTNTAPWLPFLAYQRGDVERNIQKLTASIKEAEGIVSQAKDRLAARDKEMDDIIAKAREASAAAGAAVFTKDFRTAADQMDADAQTWLRVTALVATGTLAMACLMWFLVEPGLDQGQLFQKLSTKLVVLAVLLTATIWCGRNYKALKHLATINRHRAMSIQTLQAFSAAASDSQVKDAVLLEATRAVFGNVPTGYIEGASGDSDFKVVEVARSILPKPSGSV